MTDFVPPLVILGFGAVLIVAAKFQKRWNENKLLEAEKLRTLGGRSTTPARERRAA